MKKRILSKTIIFFFCFGSLTWCQDSTDDLAALLDVKISSAAKHWQTINEAPASATIISSREIEAYGFKTVSDVLQSVRGFYISDDRNYSYLGVRGFSRPTDYINRVLLLLNGHTVNEIVYGGAFIANDLAIDINSVERIEIIRGSSSALYGTSAMLAIVNVVTKEVKDDFAIVSGSVGSYKNYQSMFTLGKDFGNDFTLLLSGKIGDIKGQSLYYNEFDSDSTNNGVAENLDWEKFHGFNLQAKYNKFSINGFYSSRKKAVPTAPYQTIFNDPSIFTIDKISFLELKYDDRIAPDKNIMGRIFWDYTKYEGAWPYDVLQNDKSRGISFGFETQFIWDALVNYRIVTGLEYHNITKAEYITNAGETTYFNGNFPYQIFGVYLNNEYQPSDNFMLNFGLRLDSYSNIGTMVTPRASVIYYPFESSTIKLLFGQAYRAPNVYEYNFMDPNNGYLGNPNLKSEKIRTFELIWEEKINKVLFATASVYNYLMSNIIETALIPIDSVYRFENVGEVNANGAELQIDCRLNNGFIAYINYAIQKAKNESDDSEISNSPKHLAKLGFVLPVFENISIASNINYESKRLTVYDTYTKDFLLVNMNLHIGKLLDHFDLAFGVNNLLNATYKLPGGYEHEQPSIAQNGRNYCFTLKLNF